MWHIDSHCWPRLTLCRHRPSPTSRSYETTKRVGYSEKKRKRLERRQTERRPTDANISDRDARARRQRTQRGRRRPFIILRCCLHQPRNAQCGAALRVFRADVCARDAMPLSGCDCQRSCSPMMALVFFPKSALSLTRGTQASVFLGVPTGASLNAPVRSRCGYSWKANKAKNKEEKGQGE